MNENAKKFYEENYNFYVNGFIDYWFKYYDYIPTEEDVKEEFRWYMYDYKNCNIDYRFSIFKKMLNDILEKMLNIYLNEEK